MTIVSDTANRPQHDIGNIPFGLLLRSSLKLPYYVYIINHMVSGLWQLNLSSLTATQLWAYILPPSSKAHNFV